MCLEGDKGYNTKLHDLHTVTGISFLGILYFYSLNVHYFHFATTISSLWSYCSANLDRAAFKTKQQRPRLCLCAALERSTAKQAEWTGWNDDTLLSGRQRQLWAVQGGTGTRKTSATWLPSLLFVVSGCQRGACLSSYVRYVQDTSVLTQDTTWEQGVQWDDVLESTRALNL